MRSAVLFAAAGFSILDPVAAFLPSLHTQGIALRSAHAGMVATPVSPALLGPRLQRPLLRMSGAVEEEECDGPARSGEIGNVDTTVAKAKPAEEIKTDGIINLTDDAIKQIGKLRESKGEDLVLRVGVRAGGWCSGMSYVMEFEDTGKIDSKDTSLEFPGFQVVVDPKSLMFIYGMTLNYSDALIGGGFQFSNPNADSTCGCGQSFGA